jgi:hypothetical protein
MGIERLPGASLKLGAFVTRIDPQDQFVRLWRIVPHR